MIKLERILVPTDFSDCANRAVAYASELAKRFGAELHLLHVVQPPVAAYAYAAPLPEDVLHPEVPAEKELEALEVPNVGQISRIERSIRTGTPFVDIVRYAKENDVDLIVIGTHGRTGLTHMLLGSVAEKVVRKASCPVLTVRLEGHQFVMP
jgi:nucleotide-binding universal stress UspA family protein